jgi:multiple sugar transport system permease protein
MSRFNRRCRRGQIPLWFAGILLGVLVVTVCVWTYFSTRPESGDGRTQIVFWNASMFGSNIYSVLHQFEQANPQYKVIASASVSRDLTSDAQRLLCAVAGAVPPDLVYFDRFAIGEWAAKGALTDLNPYIAAQKPNDPYLIDPAHYYQWAMDEARYAPPGSGKVPGLFGIPTGVDIRLLYVNNVALRQAGLVDANGKARPPKNWSELEDYAKKLTLHDKQNKLVQLGFAPAFGNSWLTLYAFEAGGHLLSTKTQVKNGITYPPHTLVTMNDPQIVRALRFMTDVYDDDGGYQAVNNFQSGFQGDMHDPFITSKVAIKIDGDWGLQAIAQWDRDMDFDLLPAPMPDDRPKDPPVTWAGGFSMVIPSTARERDGAFKLMQFLLSDQTQRFLWEGDRQTMESQGQLYLPRLTSNMVQYAEMVGKYIDGNPNMPPAFRRAYTTIGRMLPQTMIRQPSPVGQLLFVKHKDATDAALEHGDWSHYTSEQKNAEIKQDLTDAQEIVQRKLDEVVQPLPPYEVKWGGYFGGYAVLITMPFVMIWWAVRRGRKIRAYKPAETWAALMFASPWLIGMICLTLGPILFSIILSFTRYDVLNNARYVGLDNYKNLFHDALFFKSLGNTVFMLLRVPLGMALSLAIAMLLNQKVRGIGSYRTIYYLPTIVPLVAAALLWISLLNDTFGLVNTTLRWIFDLPPLHWIESLINHLHTFRDGPFHFTPPGWLSDANWCKPSMILMGLWAAGGGMIIWLAGLQAIPRQLYEAATVDGASKWQQFLNVTVPMLSPYILFNAIVGVIGTMQIFGEAYILFPDGGSNNAGMFYAYYLFEQAFRFFSMGLASAMAWVLFIVVLLLTLIQLYLSKKWVHYDQT